MPQKTWVLPPPPEGGGWVGAWMGFASLRPLSLGGEWGWTVPPPPPERARRSACKLASNVLGLAVQAGPPLLLLLPPLPPPLLPPPPPPLLLLLLLSAGVPRTSAARTTSLISVVSDPWVVACLGRGVRPTDGGY